MTKCIKSIFKWLLVAFIGFVMCVFIFNAQRYAQTTLTGLKLWALCVVPSLLPFFFLTALLTATGVSVYLARIFKGPSKVMFGADGVLCYIRIMGLLSGYPVGAKIISDLYLGKVITKNQATKYALSTSTSGPIYIVGTVASTLLGAPHVGVTLLITHYLTSLLNGVIFRKLPDNGHIAPLVNNNRTDAVLYNAMFGAVTSLTLVGGFIAVFYTAAQIALDFKLLSPIVALLTPLFGEELSQAFALGLIECTSGIKAISVQPLTDKSICLVSQLIAFGGLSVWLQTIAYLKRANANVLWFALSKLVQTITAYPICYIVLKVV